MTEQDLTRELAALKADNEMMTRKIGSLCLELEGWRRPIGIMYPSEQPSVSMLERATGERNEARLEAAEYRAWIEDRYADENCRVWGGCSQRIPKCDVCSARDLLAKFTKDEEYPDGP